MQGGTPIEENGDGTDINDIRERNNMQCHGPRSALRCCAFCQEESPIVMGLCAITDEIVSAARLKKRKLQEDMVSSKADLDSAKKSLLHAQDRVIHLKEKYGEMQRHLGRAEQNHNIAADLSKTASIQLNDAISSNTETDSLKNLQALAKLCGAVLKSTTTEMERVTKKTTLIHDNLQTARKRVEEYVRLYEDQIRRRDRASTTLQEEVRLMDVVAEFIQKENR